jgi:hypothetical protein
MSSKYFNDYTDKEILDAKKSIGQWFWRRLGESILPTNIREEIVGRKTFTYYDLKDVKSVYPGYWEEWGPLIGHAVGFDDRINGYWDITVKPDGDLEVKAPTEKKHAEKYSERYFGGQVMHEAGALKADIADEKGFSLIYQRTQALVQKN